MRGPDEGCKLEPLVENGELLYEVEDGETGER